MEIANGILPTLGSDRMSRGPGRGSGRTMLSVLPLSRLFLLTLPFTAPWNGLTLTEG